RFRCRSKRSAKRALGRRQDQADTEVALGRDLPRAVGEGDGVGNLTGTVDGEGEVVEASSAAVEPRGDRTVLVTGRQHPDATRPRPGEVDPHRRLVLAAARLLTAEEAGEE